MKKSILSLVLVSIMLISLILQSCGSEVVSSDTSTTINTDATTITQSTTEATTEVTTEATTESTTTTEPLGYQIPNVNGDGEDFVISEEELYDKLLGAWLGKAIGVTWAATIEFRAKGTILPASQFPKYLVNDLPGCYNQDDMYVMIPFMQAMYDNGINSEMSVYLDYYAKSTFPVWHSNLAARDNARRGLVYPLTGSYAYNPHCDDIDWQIDCDFIGIMYPAMEYISAKQSFDIGQIICYGDGVYGGSFICAMHSAAYRTTNTREIVQAGYDVIADNTQFKSLIGDVLKAYDDGKTWEQAWQIIQTKWGSGDICPIDGPSLSNIDAKLNSGYVAIGLLWGNGNFEKTVEIAGRCGQDADCNASTAASILGNAIGAKAIDESYYNGVKSSGETYNLFTVRKRYFTGSELNFYDLVDLSYELTKMALDTTGAVKDTNGNWTIKTDDVLRQVPYQQRPEQK